MTTVANPPPVPQHVFTPQEAMAALEISKRDINKIVMDFLIKEGYPNAATLFAKEANVELQEDDTCIEERVQIRNSIYRGDLGAAIEGINDIDPSLLDTDPTLHFSLLRLQLIELIKLTFDASDDERPKLIESAINFAQLNLAPHAPLKEELRIGLERAMSLLVIPREIWQNPTPTTGQKHPFASLSDLVDPKLKVEVAKNVNLAILRIRGYSQDTKLYNLLSAQAWTESVARDRGVSVPESGYGEVLGDKSSNGGDTQMTEGNDPVSQYTNLS